jgi:hypothetical protein
MGIHGQCPHGTLPFQATNHPSNKIAQSRKEVSNV